MKPGELVFWEPYPGALVLLLNGPHTDVDDEVWWNVLSDGEVYGVAEYELLTLKAAWEEACNVGEDEVI